MEKEKKDCLICGTKYEPKRSDSRFCSKSCMNKWYRKNRLSGTKLRKNPTPPKIDDAIFLPADAIKAFRNAGIKEAIKILERSLA